MLRTLMLVFAVLGAGVGCRCFSVWVGIYSSEKAFFLDVLVNTLLKEKRLFFDNFGFHTKKITLPKIIMGSGFRVTLHG